MGLVLPRTRESALVPVDLVPSERGLAGQARVEDTEVPTAQTQRAKLGAEPGVFLASLTPFLDFSRLMALY